jgi:hypothetical protein
LITWFTLKVYHFQDLMSKLNTQNSFWKYYNIMLKFQSDNIYLLWCGIWQYLPVLMWYVAVCTCFDVVCGNIYLLWCGMWQYLPVVMWYRAIFTCCDVVPRCRTLSISNVFPEAVISRINSLTLPTNNTLLQYN